MEDKTSDDISSKKRKLSSENTAGKIIEDNGPLENSCEVVQSEPDVKMSSLDSLEPLVNSLCSDSGIESLSYNSQNSLDEPTTNNLDKRLLQLEDEVQRLKAENETLKLKPCHCETFGDNAIIRIKFNDLDNFQLHKSKFLRLFDSCISLDVQEQESNLSLCVYEDGSINSKEWVVVDETDCAVPLDKHKKKKKRRSSVVSNEPVDIFMVDTTPSIATKNTLQYDRKFDFLGTVTKEHVKMMTPKTSVNVCFNCDEEHTLRDCPKPKNFGKINAARQKLKMQYKANVYKRYHLEDDQRYGNLQAGKISDKLKDALGLRSNQLPEYIYRMRQLGYPPGWYNEILSLQESNLVMFDFNGQDASKLKKNVQDLDINRVVEYHGFNAPLQKGYKDEYRIYGCSAYSKESSKQNMIKHLLSLRKEPEENLEACDMEIDNNPCDREIEEINAPGTQENGDKACSNNNSPTLNQLESEKDKLLAQLKEAVPDSQEEVKDILGDFVTIDTTGSVDDLNITPCNIEADSQEDLNGSANLDITKLNIIKTSSFGTPILKSASPYARLPKPENFTKDVSDVINFENLPNSTGKYDQMVGVIEKVRTTLKNLNDTLL